MLSDGFIKAIEDEKEFYRNFGTEEKRIRHFQNLVNILKLDKDSPEYNTLAKVYSCGLSECNHTIETDFGPIDFSVAGFIEYCNSNDYATLASCSGLAKEHQFLNDTSGYISFDLRYLKNRSLLKRLNTLNMEFELRHCYFHPALTIRWLGEEDLNIKIKQIQDIIEKKLLLAAFKNVLF